MEKRRGGGERENYKKEVIQGRKRIWMTVKVQGRAAAKRGS